MGVECRLDGWGTKSPLLAVGIPTSRKRREKWGTHFLLIRNLTTEDAEGYEDDLHLDDVRANRSGVGDDLLREFEPGKRRKQRDVDGDAVADDWACERADVSAGGLDSAAAGRCVEREPGSAVVGGFGKSDFV